jgi:hypothetical protein
MSPCRLRAGEELHPAGDLWLELEEPFTSALACAQRHSGEGDVRANQLTASAPAATAARLIQHAGDGPDFIEGPARRLLDDEPDCAELVA